MGLYELNKKLKIARENGFIIIQILNSTLKNYSSLSNINICYLYMLSLCHRNFFRIMSQNQEYVEIHCNFRNIPFHFAIRKWYLYNITQCWYSIITPIQILQLKK